MMESPGQMCVVLGVTGSIAAYKAADLASKLVQSGIDLHVVMTDSATKLVGPHTFLTLSQNPVVTDLWGVPTWQPEHIALADKADLCLLAPATANIIGKLANGIADDALSTFALSFDGPILMAPAMNPRMWANPAVQNNCRILRERGVVFVEPEVGRVACGDMGTGRLAPIAGILHTVHVQLAARADSAVSGAQQLKILVTAGPTREALDPVRFITNRSTGKMGYALAEVATAAGHDVTLISGPVALPRPGGCRVVDVVSAADMAGAVKTEFPACDLLIMCAAVADYRPADVAEQKIKKGAGSMVVELERTEDILSAASAAKKPGQRIMGFAAETENVAESARAKLERKRLDWIVANDVSRSDIGFATDENEVLLISADEVKPFPRMTKVGLAAALLAEAMGAFG